MRTEPDDEQAPEERSIGRRTALKTLGGVLVTGTASTGLAAGRRGRGNGRGGPPHDRGTGRPADDERGPPTADHGERTIFWEGQGSEHATQDCPGAVGSWHWVLTPGGPEEFESVGPLEVTFEDGSEQTAQASQRGRGAYHFDLRKRGGGTIETAAVTVVDGGRNSLLTLSDGSCERADILYWQVDFGEGEVKDPPAYWPDDVMAALGNSEDGVTENPSLLRKQTEGQLADVEIAANEFTFDDTADPSEVTVDFTVRADGDPRELHLSSWMLPGAFDQAEIGEQQRYDSTVDSFNRGERGTLTVEIPQ